MYRMKLRETRLIHGGIFIVLLIPGVMVSMYMGKGHIHDSVTTAVVVWTSFVAAISYLLWFQLFVWRCPSCEANLGKHLGNHCSNCGTDLRPHH
jgi:hypothetical protein